MLDSLSFLYRKSHTRDHAKINTELMRFRTGQCLINSEYAVEAFGCDPLFFVYEFLTDHGDLRDRSAPRKETEFEKAEENCGEGLMWNVEVGVGCIQWNSLWRLRIGEWRLEIGELEN